MHWEVVMHADPSCQDVVFSCANGSFHGVGPVVMWWGKLDINVVVFEEAFELVGALIVDASIFGLAATICEHLMDSGEGFGEFHCRSVFIWP